MASYLETIPLDILQHIAVLSGSSSALEPPGNLYRLLQTSSTIYQSLNAHLSPHIYSRLFSSKFDTRAHCRRYRGRLPDSAFAAELLCRSKLLRRSHRAELSTDGLIQDLWTALWMFLENDSLNEQQLLAAGFPHFLLSLARMKLSDTDTDGRTDNYTIKMLIIWLLSLTLSRQIIMDMSKAHRDELYGLIYPYIFMDKQEIPPKLRTSGDSGHTMPVYVYLCRQMPLVPEPAIAAIHLTLVLLESNTLQIPPHLPETRAIAIATLRSGPTIEDYRFMASYETTLSKATHRSPDPACAALPISTEPDPSTNNDMFFGAILRSLGEAQSTETFAYTPGTMSGLWEGVFRILNMPITNIDSSADHDSLFSSGLIFPMQCAMVEFVCSDFGIQSNPLDPDILVDSDICPPHLISTNDTELAFNGRRYKKHTIHSGTAPANDDIETKIPAQEARSCSDVMLLGQTLDDYDQAWGGYKFSGRVTNNGRVLLKREQKYTDGQQRGVWIFEGYLRSDSLLLGRWRVSGNPSAVDKGVFSMGKARGR
ncbi:hypothetical protein JR316_0011023 [Psilocybe cubensis]|uniref:Uncharacterized protein n=2 Tax=Psilocybe cubensis TaxID=181762 RepID=A0ACB8GNX7_PSICU|nr:hypothetical protein JR316_0011023 [Psilocybe cubensis]KAH9477107.1 hypothetical protein JR316_0011023 [Psilocybe cubensis]